MKAKESPENQTFVENFKSLFSKAVTRESDPSKEEFFTILHWFRQIIGLIFGLVVGFYHLTGIFVIVIFMLMNVGLTYFYANNFLTVDEEKYESQELYTEGMMNSFGAFVVDFIRLGKYLSYWNFSILVGLDTWTYIFPSLEIMRKIK